MKRLYRCTSTWSNYPCWVVADSIEDAASKYRAHMQTFTTAHNSEILSVARVDDNTVLT